MSAADLGAKVADLAARLAMAEARLHALENPENRASRSLAELADRIDADTPGKVPSYETAKLEAQERPPKEPIEAMGSYLACRRARVAVE